MCYQRYYIAFDAEGSGCGLLADLPENTPRDSRGNLKKKDSVVGLLFNSFHTVKRYAYMAIRRYVWLVVCI